MALSYRPLGDPTLRLHSREDDAKFLATTAISRTLAHKNPQMMKLELKGLSSHDFSEPSTASSPSASSLVFSDVERRSPSEIAALVRNTYAALCEKERDLHLAAELGRSLLEDNLDIKAKYEQLLQSNPYAIADQQPQLLHDTRYGNQEPYSPTSCKSGHDELIAAPLQHSGDFDHESVHTDDNGMRLMPSHYAHDATVAMLGQKNAEIQNFLDHVVQNNTLKSISGNEKTNQMLKEIEQLQTELDEASAKIQTLENERYKNLAYVATMSRDPMRYYHASMGETNQTVADLTRKLESLEQDHQRLVLAKTSAEERLEQAKRSMQDIKKEFEALESIEEKYEAQQRASQQQREHIAKLNQSIEEYRTILTKVRDRGLWSAEDDISLPETPQTPTDPDHDDYSLSALYERQRRREKERTTARDTLPTGPAMPKPSESLLTELQRTWQKEHQKPPSVANVFCEEPEALDDHSSPITPEQRLMECVEPPMDTTHTIPAHSFTPGQPIEDSTLSEISHEDHPPSPLFHTGSHYETEDDQSTVLSFVSSKAEQYKHITSWEQEVVQEPEPKDHLYPAIPDDASESVAMYKRDHDVHWKRAPVHAAKKNEPRKRNFVVRVLLLPLWLPLWILSGLWAWFRFSIILALALVINVWQGPDAILEK